MWKRRILKKKARASMKQSYWRIISVCFLIAVLTSSYPVSTTFFSLQDSNSAGYEDAVFSLPLPNSEVIEQTITYFLGDTALAGLFRGAAAHISSFAVDLFSTNLSVFFTILRTVNVFFTNRSSVPAVFSALGILVLLLYMIFVNNILLVGEKRYFLENRNYPQTSVSKIFFLYKLRCISNPAWVMVCRSFFQFLWNLTVIGGVIKHYEYILIPYILAENPKISRRDAFFLSKQLMRHHKRKLFLLDLSFLGWQILSLFTLGLLDLIFVIPYQSGCRAELYAVLRRNYVLSRSARYELLNDSYLEHVPSEDELLINKALYDDSQGPYTQISYFAPEQYPVFLFSVQPPLKAVRSMVKPDRKYDIFSYIFLFFSFSVFGWLLETLLQLMRTGTLEDQIVLFGPWIPLYGIYGVLLLLGMKPLLKQPAAVFFSCFLLYSILQYLSSFAFDMAFGFMPLDYSAFLLNINGRVYLGGSVTYALLGCAFLYYLAPRWTARFMKLGRPRRIMLSVLLCILFAADIGVSVLIHVAF